MTYLASYEGFMAILVADGDDAARRAVVEAAIDAGYEAMGGMVKDVRLYELSVRDEHVKKLGKGRCWDPDRALTVCWAPRADPHAVVG